MIHGDEVLFIVIKASVPLITPAVSHVWKAAQKMQ